MAQPWTPVCPGSYDGGAEQSISGRGGAAQPTFTQLPDNPPVLTVGFYNVGIVKQTVEGRKWKRTEQKLKKDVVNAFRQHDLHMLCLSELGELGKGIARALGTNVEEWMLNLLADSDVHPVSIYAEGHYLTIVKNRHVTVEQHTTISGFITDQRTRSFQHFQVRPRGWSGQVSVINCHAPSSKHKKLTVHRRTGYFKAFHQASGANPFIWGGDFNTGPVQLTTSLKEIDRRYVVHDAETSSAEQPGGEAALL